MHERNPLQFEIGSSLLNNKNARVFFKLVRDFSVAPYKPSDSAQKFDGPLNQASQVREAESINKKQKQ